MSQYTTGEMAKACGVTVRTVQYYDTRGILTPSALSEGGRRLYDDGDLQKLKVICFLREIGLSIDVIGQLFMEEHPENVIEILLEQQEQELKTERGALDAKLEKLTELRKAVADAKHFTVESIGDIAITVTNKKKLNRMYLMAFLLGLPLVALQIAGVLLWALEGIWWVFVLWAALAIPFAIFFSRYYYRHVAYVCPECHTVFRPTFREMFFASHTPKTRRLTCTSCGHKGFCVEVWGGDEA
ncbi:MAG: MerR family transcriptional regulator [Clostridia bacterium]|nr:MerR family transcriptional regulator [Clostridia bacterium]